MLKREQPTIFGDGEQTRDYLFVDDTVHAFALAAAERAGGQVLNVGTGTETSVNELFQTLAPLAGYRAEPAYAPAREGDVRRSALDASLAGRELGWKPWTSLEEGLAQVVAWASEH
jgi:nucleoside-diphosphate-sugar epimerase